MRFHPTKLEGVWLIEAEPREDERGFLARTYCETEFAQRGLNTRWPQCNLTLTRKRGMLRGLHYQAAPKGETKLIRCQAGAVWDVMVDLRAGSASYGRWEAFELTAANRFQVYAPAGCAHGMQCLTDHCEVFYLMSESYESGLARGIRWNDPVLNIPWPVGNPEVSERDRSLPLFSATL